jgi:acyl-CoA synthetase (AMP-forming)/AMP-acid ligase II
MPVALDQAVVMVVLPLFHSFGQTVHAELDALGRRHAGADAALRSARRPPS